MVKRIAIALIVALSGNGAACGGEEDPGGTPTGGGQTLSPGALPTSSPGAAIGTVSEGEASVQVAGDLEAEFTSELAAPAIYSPPPGTLVSSGGWGVRTASGSPAQPSPALGRRRPGSRSRLARHGTWKAFFTSVRDDCTITIDTAKANSIAGSFACSGLTSSHGTAMVDASGRFSASA